MESQQNSGLKEGGAIQDSMEHSQDGERQINTEPEIQDKLETAKSVSSFTQQKQLLNT